MEVQKCELKKTDNILFKKKLLIIFIGKEIVCFRVPAPSEMYFIE